MDFFDKILQEIDAKFERQRQVKIEALKNLCNRHNIEYQAFNSRYALAALMISDKLTKEDGHIIIEGTAALLSRRGRRSKNR